MRLRDELVAGTWGFGARARTPGMTPITPSRRPAERGPTGSSAALFYLRFLGGVGLPAPPGSLVSRRGRRVLPVPRVPAPRGGGGSALRFLLMPCCVGRDDLPVQV